MRVRVRVRVNGGGWAVVNVRARVRVWMNVRFSVSAAQCSYQPLAKLPMGGVQAGLEPAVHGPYGP